MGIHEDSAPCFSLPPDSGSPNDCLHRRYVDHGRVPGCGTEPRDRHGCIIRRTGLHSKHGQVRVKPYLTAGVSRLAGELCRSSPSSTRGEDQANPRRGLTAASSRDMHCSQVSTVHRQVECCSTSSISCPAFLPPPTERPTAGPVSERAGLQFLSPAFSGSSRGDTVVATTSLPMERQIFDSASRADGDLLGCFLSRMGSSMREDPHRRTMVSVGTRVAHQLFGAEGSNSGLTVLNQRSDGDIGITAAGQPDCSIVHQPLGGHSLSPTHRSGKKSVTVVCLQGPSVDSSTHSRGGQSDSGLRVQRAEGSLGLEIIPSSVSDNQCNLGSPRGGPVCISPVPPIEPLLQLETGSTGRGNECLSTGLGPSEGLCEPPMVPNWEGPEPSEDSTGSGDTGSSRLEGTTLVPSSPRNVMGLPSTTPSTTRPVSDDIINGGTGLPTPTSRMAYLRGKFASQSLSRAAGDLLLSSWRTKSNKTYDSHFKKWVCWCTERGSDPVSGPVSDVVNFLADLHGEGYQSSSLNVFRSAISSVHGKVDGVEVGKHPIISRLLKGAFHL